VKKEDKINLIEETKFIINRYDFFYETINSKSNFYMAINTLIIGGIMTGYPILNKQYQFKGIMEYIPIIILLLNLAALIFTVLAIKPFLSKKGCSLLFFNNVANRHQEEYLNLFQHVTKKKMLKDSATQVHELACGLRNKFQKINWATFLTSLQLILIMLFTIILIIKY
jgi:hypothetical protein